MDVPDGIPTRQGGRCRRCGGPLKLRTPTFGVPYFACPEPHDPPVVVQSPRDLGYATALVGSRLVDPLDGDESRGFDADAPDPGRFVNRVWERMALTHASDVDRERDEHRDDSTPDAEIDTDDDAQPGLGRWA